MRKVVVWGFAVVAAVFLFTGAQAQRIAPIQSAPLKSAAPVEVTNFPAVQPISGNVQVSNLPLDGDGTLKVTGIVVAAPRIHFVGVTTATFPLSETSALHINRACGFEFPDSRACEVNEITRSIPVPPDGWLPSGGAAWILKVSSERCVNWMGDPGFCSEIPLPVACCGY